MSSEVPLGYADMLRRFPDDDQVRQWRAKTAEAQGHEDGEPTRWEEGRCGRSSTMRPRIPIPQANVRTRFFAYMPTFRLWAEIRQAFAL